MNFQTHINILEQRLSRATGIMYKLKSVLPRRALLKLYYALIHSHLLYGLIIWGLTFPSYIKRLTKFQNKAVKLIGGGNFCDSPMPFYFNLNILKFQDLYKIEVAKFVHRFLQNTLPSSFSDYFTPTIQSTRRLTQSTSNNSNLYVPKYRNNRLRRSIKYQGVKVWNSISPEILKLPTKSFIQKLIKYYLQSYET